jgi:ribosome-binding factor A
VRAALNEAAGFLRNGLFKRLQIHTVPTLHFSSTAPPSVRPT